MTPYGDSVHGEQRNESGAVCCFGNYRTIPMLMAEQETMAGQIENLFLIDSLELAICQGWQLPELRY
jgi:hypothetical protein